MQPLLGIMHEVGWLEVVGVEVGDLEVLSNPNHSNIL